MRRIILMELQTLSVGDDKHVNFGKQTFPNLYIASLRCS